ncbi:uncharacterized protein EI90DRAFT_1665437 [Cantharellus anzutake]|uniref:uncharacterized protein n=1 Tax=Cantharellus anzutake TaxID=1750568 RepID=UPI0019046742|nr:uncharacterized protein EI90DRAFT_1665437 [Cantharellus anzutake]KAF8308784.1 hypothetical protein EI90DRAFT_1665437 [Cantharellus anzutake]
MSLIDVALDAELRSAFMDAELRFLNAVAEDDRRGTFQTEFRSITQRAEAAMASNLLSLETVDLIRSVVASIRATAMRFMEGCNATARLESQIVNQWKSILGARLQTSARTPTAPSKRVKQHHIDSVTAEMTKYRPCRDYFLSHLGAPYPTAADKKQMAAKIGCEVASVSQWFTNHRRRSSWMSVMKDFANNDKGTMQRLVQTVISPDPSTPDVDVPDEARRAVSNVRAYFEKITAPTVSEEFMEMVSQPPMSDEELAAYRARRKQIRRVRMEAKRALAAKFAAKHGEGVKVAERAVPLVGKRKRNSEDTPPDEDERPRKRRGALAQIKVLISRDPNIRFVVKEDGTVRRLRRKGPLPSGTTFPRRRRLQFRTHIYHPTPPKLSHLTAHV